MKATETKLEGCFVLEPTIFEDKRGYFFESFNQEKFNTLINKNVAFVQDNESFSSKGVLRGLHYQVGAHAQAKLVRVIKGKVLDVAVDVRANSKTFGQHVAVELSEDNKKQLFVPRGFAHGFIVLSDTAIFSYKCDNLYNKESEGGIIYNDPKLNIDWQLPENELLVSQKDVVLPNLDNARL
ncbi:dTDP-4-dehydrorhamnose 3,5-epimerase [Lacinutrix sp. C3R15]|uniref:dTDP-4-dehydrorhamnose 3,5-epimerase n=1 Tax=Flavobacteriaceae TaxID=49546 RepID=UPI001C08136F|nr:MULTISPECIES: dTDP-4-dehydrorhamnose 3,5-epimerase [Flavobacteriaceae]MBU2938047.1 dTDP-4-dehydrorhamnose 3,5-epimerase [Lacinutrix sp. C3R15]MDO6621361.1 dTDP-4-dehydrorhamnose 3,5-epimerase [Oceanihabitans sp. 1_MG-2023]